MDSTDEANVSSQSAIPVSSKPSISQSLEFLCLGKPPFFQSIGRFSADFLGFYCSGSNWNLEVIQNRILHVNHPVMRYLRMIPSLMIENRFVLVYFALNALDHLSYSHFPSIA